MKILDVPQSGSQSGVTSSRNRFGQYRRTRAIPVNPNSTAQGTARARLAANAAAWRALTDEDRSGWKSGGLQVQRTDALGQTYTLTGFQFFVSCNNNLALIGESGTDQAPGIVTPDAILTASITASESALSVAYTPTPMPTGTHLIIYASPQRSAGRGFESDLRFIQVTAAAAASPCNIKAAYEAKFGACSSGNRIFFAFVAACGGFLSGPLLKSVVVT